MHTENSIVIHAPLEKIFETAGDLSLWPKILPHYRWIRYIEKSSTKSVVQMAAMRSWIPVQWTSEQEIDRNGMQLRFHHLRALTKGMEVVWTFAPSRGGTEVCIRHDLKPTIPLVGRFIAEKIIGQFFISHIASQTLAHLKRYVERTHGA